MYAAKSEGRGTFRIFVSEYDVKARQRRQLELDLRQALARGEFEVHYQPLVDLSANVVNGCEALLRWRHPERGMVSPADFIPVAEDTGLISEIGEWVLRQACTEAASWPGDIHIAVNVSPVQFRSKTLALKVAAALAESGLAPGRLELEITETVLIRDDAEALTILQQLRELGVRIALDDFGTGYSSLSYLHRFPFDKIKIDRSFIATSASPRIPRRSCRPWCTWPPPATWRRRPKASRPKRSARCCSSSDAARCRAGCSARRCRRRS